MPRDLQAWISFTAPAVVDGALSCRAAAGPGAGREHDGVAARDAGRDRFGVEVLEVHPHRALAGAS